MDNKDLRALYEDVIASLSGTIADVCDLDDTDETVVNQMIEEVVSDIVKAIYIKAISDVKSSVNQLIIKRQLED